MATVNISAELDVIEKYQCLLAASLGSESIYIRTKETLLALVAAGSMSSTEQAEVISNVLGGMSSSLASSGLSTALQWAAQERQFEVEKLKLSKDLDILDQEILLREAQVDKLEWESIGTQAQTIRMYGTPTVIDGQVLSLAADGKVLWDTRMVEQQRANLIKEVDVLDMRVKEAQAGIHRTVADTVVNHGAWTYDLGSTGIATSPVRTAPNGVVPLSDIQRVIAAEQAKGYSYNAWANSVTASAGMLGTAIASDGAIPDVATLVGLFRTSLEKLQGVVAPTIPSV